MPPEKTPGSIDPNDLPALEAALLVYAGPDRVVSADEYMAAHQASPRRGVVVRSHIPLLDAAIENFQGGELITISGQTKHGKTLLARTLTRNFLLERVTTLWFSYEIPPHQMIERSPMAFYLPLTLASTSLKWIRQRVIEAKIKHGVDVVVLDHLHFLVDLLALKHPSLEIGGIIRQLKLLALAHNLIIFLLAHTVKAVQDEELTEASIRDSSFVSQESDSTLMIARRMDPATKLYTNRAWLSVRNHRRTGVMGVRIPLVHINGWLEEETHDGS